MNVLQANHERFIELIRAKRGELVPTMHALGTALYASTYEFREADWCMTEDQAHDKMDLYAWWMARFDRLIAQKGGAA